MQRRRGLLGVVIAIGALALAALPLQQAQAARSTAAAPAVAAAVSARATISHPKRQYVGDFSQDGQQFTFMITNNGGRGLDRFTISVPKAWKTVGCTKGPTGWKRTKVAGGCVLQSAAGGAGNLEPGQTVRVDVRAGVLPSPKDVDGLFTVRVQTSSPVVGFTAGSFPVHAWSVVMDVVGVTSQTTSLADPCGFPINLAPVGSVTNFVVCGRNQTNTTLHLSPALMELGGNFVTGGSPHTHGVAPSTRGETVVLAIWTGVKVTSEADVRKHVTVDISSPTGQHAPPTSFPLFHATDGTVTARPLTASTTGGTPVTLTLYATSSDGYDTSFSIASRPAHGTLSAPGKIACESGVPRFCSSHVVYTPASGATGPDSFTYTATDQFGTFSSTAAATITNG